MDMVESRLEFCKTTYGVDHTILFRGDGSEVDQIREATSGDTQLLAHRTDKATVTDDDLVA